MGFLQQYNAKQGKQTPSASSSGVGFLQQYESQPQKKTATPSAEKKIVQTQQKQQPTGFFGKATSFIQQVTSEPVKGQILEGIKKVGKETIKTAKSYIKSAVKEPKQTTVGASAGLIKTGGTIAGLIQKSILSRPVAGIGAGGVSIGIKPEIPDRWNLSKQTKAFKELDRLDRESLPKSQQEARTIGEFIADMFTFVLAGQFTGATLGETVLVPAAGKYLPKAGKLIPVAGKYLPKAIKLIPLINRSVGFLGIEQLEFDPAEGTRVEKLKTDLIMISLFESVPILAKGLSKATKNSLPKVVNKISKNLKSKRGAELNETEIEVKAVKDQIKKDTGKEPEVVMVENITKASDKELKVVSAKELGFKEPKPKPINMPRAIPKDLIQEARKYKTAEEFVKAQPKVFHGTTAKFKEFSLKNLGRQGRTEGSGFYFTDSKMLAQSYTKGKGKLIEAVVDIKKPMTLTQRKITDSQLKEIVKRIIKQDREALANYDIDINEVGEKRAINQMVNEFLKPIEADIDIPNEIINSGVMKAEDINKILTDVTGYDGVIAKWGDRKEKIIVAFNPNQIKTKAQLVNIFNQAKRTKPKPVKAEPKPKTEIPKELNVLKQMAVDAKSEAAFTSRALFNYSISGIQERALSKYAGKTLADKLDTFYKNITKPKGVKVKPKVKTRESRVFARLQKENPEMLQGDLPYDITVLKTVFDKATKHIAKDKQEAYDVAMGRKKTSEVESVATNIEMAEKALGEGNTELYEKLIRNRSIAQTRRGVAIVAEKASIQDNSTSRYVKELMAARLDNLGKRYLSGIKDKGGIRDRGVSIIDKKAERLQVDIVKGKLNTKMALKLLDEMTCI